MTRWRQALLNAAMGFAVLSFVILVSVYTESRVQAEEDKAIRFPDTALEWLIRKQIGRWFAGIMITTYPGQTKSVKVEIIKAAAGS